MRHLLSSALEVVHLRKVLAGFVDVLTWQNVYIIQVLHELRTPASKMDKNMSAGQCIHYACLIMIFMGPSLYFRTLFMRASALHVTMLH